MTATALDDRTALVLIDLQAGTVAAPTQPYPGAEVVARATELAAAFRAAGRPVVLVRNTNAPDGSDATSARTDAARGAGGTRVHDLGPIADGLAGDGDVHVTKHVWGAFYGSDLDLQLRRRGVTQIVLGGVATSLGVESTARAAHERGYHLTLVTDAMTDINPAAHTHTIGWVFPMIGESATTAEVIDLLARQPAAAAH
jgi:nicotinamidase-related amidase